MAGILPYDLGNEFISSSYQRIIQVVSGSYYDGAGNSISLGGGSATSSYALTASYLLGSSPTSSYSLTSSYVENAQTASYAFYAVSASHEIIKEVSSSYADTASILNYWVTDNLNIVSKSDGSLGEFGIGDTIPSIILNSGSIRLLNTSFNALSGLSELKVENNVTQLTSTYLLNTARFKATKGHFQITGSLKSSGNITASAFKGDGSGLTNVPFDTSSLVSLSITSSIDSLNTFSGSAETQLGNLRTFSGSAETQLDNLKTFTGSAQTNLDTLNNLTSSFATTGSNAFTGSITATLGFTGSLYGTSSWANNAISSSHALFAEDVPLVAGPGITVNNLGITASMRTVNGVFPTNGNVVVSLAATFTGPSSSLVASSSGDVTSSIVDSSVWIVSGDPTSSNNGDSFVWSATAGEWLSVSSFDLAQGDSRYLKLDGNNGPFQGNLNMGGFDITNIKKLSATEGVVGTLTGSATNAIESASISVSNSSTISFTRGDNTTFDVVIGSGSIQEQIDSIIVTTASLVRTTDSNVTFTGTVAANNITADNNITATGNVTANTFIGDGSSLTGISTDTGSFLLSASISGSNAIEFTKGDSSTFGVTLPEASGFPYTGSAGISGSLIVDGNISANNSITNETDTFTSTPKITSIISLTQAEYDAIITKDTSTFYIIT